MPYYLYVIGLDITVCEETKFMSRNSQYVPGKPCVYVGSTAHEPDFRFEQHLKGHKANRYAREYGLYLRRRMMRRLPVFDVREDAERAERELAAKLRRKGYGVWQG